MKPTIMLTAGGTGGHLFPALALASELKRRGYDIELMTDERADKYGSAFPADKVHLIESATLGKKHPVAILRTLWKLFKGTLQSLKVIRQAKPKVIVGFGGYPTFPPMFAARLNGLTSILHEANGVMGRSNKMLAANVNAVATTFELTNVDKEIQKKSHDTGNPLRDNVLAVCNRAYAAPEADGAFHLLVFGGSQGATVFSQVLPEAIKLMTQEERERLAIVQQCRPADLAEVEAAYKELGIAVQLAPFFTDLPERIAEAHLVISRSGASTVCELAAIGRPSLLVPFPGALDNDQGVNASMLADVDAALMVKQKELTAERLLAELRALMAEPQKLAHMAQAAKAKGRPDAVLRLADLTEQVAGLKPAQKIAETNS